MLHPSRSISIHGNPKTICLDQSLELVCLKRLDSSRMKRNVSIQQEMPLRDCLVSQTTIQSKQKRNQIIILQTERKILTLVARNLEAPKH